MKTPFVQIPANYTQQITPNPGTTIPPGYDIRANPPGDQIIASTKREWQGEGYAIGLESTSQAPIVAQLYGDRSSGPLFIRPGEVLHLGKFTGVRFGLPAGWCGGGLVLVKIATDPDVGLDLGTARPEIIYWRTALVVEADSDPILPLKRNWPCKFPWEYAVGAGGAAQAGTPIVHVEPTRTTLFLPDSGVAAHLAAGTIYNARLFFRNADDHGISDPFMCDVAFSAPPAGLIFPGLVATLPAEFDRLDLTAGGITLVSPDASLAVGDAIIATRYGRI
jgi:hypothetical protein